MSVTQVAVSLFFLWACVSTTKQDVQSFWKGNAKFGFDLLEALQPIVVANTNQDQDANINISASHVREYQNTMISPFSISSALGLAYAGSPIDSTTSKQMAKILHYPTHVEEFQNPLELAQHIIQQQYDLSSNNNDVDIVNRVYVNEKYKINDIIIGLLGKDYFESMNFIENEIAVKKINEWIAKQTKNKINNVISPSAVNQYTFAVIVNVCNHFVCVENMLNVSYTTVILESLV